MRGLEGTEVTLALRSKLTRQKPRNRAPLLTLPALPGVA